MTFTQYGTQLGKRAFACAVCVSALSAVTSLTGCGLERQVEHYPDMTSLSVTAQNHPHGYQRTDCFSCHVAANIHQDDRSLGLGLAATARESVETDGLSSCVDCHNGPAGLFNGVPQE